MQYERTRKTTQAGCTRTLATTSFKNRLRRLPEDQWVIDSSQRT